VSLSSDLISQFVKITKDTNKVQSESTVYGTVVYSGRLYVKLDGSDLLTPVSTTASAKDGDRVSVAISNHTATITGNVTDPSASSATVTEHADQISEFEIIVAHRVVADDIEAVNARIDALKALIAEIGSLSAEDIEAIYAEIESILAKIIEAEYLKATDIEAINAEIENLRAIFGEFENLTAEDFEAVNASIDFLKAYSADFTYVSTEVLSAVKADIKTLNTEKLSAKDAELKFANIDFSNIGEAAIEKLFSESGIIKDLIMSDGKVTGTLVGVTIIGDYIQGGTIQADKLVIKGEDGLYYKLNIEGGATVSEAITEEDLQNGLSGSIIVAKSITAEKVAVDDLVAFGATIGGFNITKNAIYSGVKESVHNTTRGIYQDNDGQFAVGDGSNYLKFFKDTDGNYKLDIAASIIRLGNGKTVEEAVEEASNIQVGARNLIRNSKNLIFSKYYFVSNQPDDSIIATLIDDVLHVEKAPAVLVDDILEVK
jgi:hypothetical protein